jgi:hypothetical protein
VSFSLFVYFLVLLFLAVARFNSVTHGQIVFMAVLFSLVKSRTGYPPGPRVLQSRR